MIITGHLEHAKATILDIFPRHRVSCGPYINQLDFRDHLIVHIPKHHTLSEVQASFICQLFSIRLGKRILQIQQELTLKLAAITVVLTLLYQTLDEVFKNIVSVG